MEWGIIIIIIIIFVTRLSAPWYQCVLCYSSFRSSLGMKCTVPLCENSHSTYQHTDLNSPKFQLKLSHTKTLSLARARPQMAEFSLTTFQEWVQGQNNLGHKMSHFHNPVQLRRSPGSVTAAGTLQSPGAAPNSALFREDWIKYHLWPLLFSSPFMYAAKDFTHKL